MKRNLFKVDGYIFGNNDSIKENLFNFIQQKGLYFVGTINEGNTSFMTITNDVLNLDGYIFSDSDTAEDIQSGFNALMKKHGYYYTGKFNIEYGEIKINI